MNQSDIIIITFTGLLQLSVAGYGMRLTRRFGVAKVGWSLFSAFALLAVVHLFEAVQQFNTGREFGIGIEIIYAFASFLLLAGLAHLEAVLKERERLERQAHKLQAVGQLAEGITHDFNNILTAIHGHVGLLLLKQHDAETTEQLDHIVVAVDRAGALTRQLLAFGRGHTTQIELLNLNAIIGNLVQMLQHLLGSKITLENSSAANLPLIVGDPTMIEQIVVNLVINARDAMPKGGKVTIGATRVANKAGGRELVCIRVSDTGSGIPPEVLPRIFEPYFTTKETGKGTGLGLATVQRIAKQHSGWVDVQSRVGAGTDFTVYFPCAPRSVVEVPTEPALTAAGVAGCLL